MIAASKLTSLVSQVQDTFHYTQHKFMDLNSSLRCSGLGTVSYIPPLFLVLCSRQLLSWKEFRKHQLLQILSVLYTADKPQIHLSQTRLYEGIFQQEPAIAKLDRLFTPIHRSSKRMYTTQVQTSIPLSGDFILPMNRSPGFRSCPRDLRPFRLAFALVTFQRKLALPRK